MPIIKPPTQLRFEYITGPSVFLAGSIEQGTAANWQDQLTLKLLARFNTDLTILNPRRDHWDDTWEQRADNPSFADQVHWELDAIAGCDLVLMYFDKRTRSPVTLLELGLIAGQWADNIVVCCPEGFWRKGNVDIVCRRFGVDMAHDLDEMVEYAAEYFGIDEPEEHDDMVKNTMDQILQLPRDNAINTAWHNGHEIDLDVCGTRLFCATCGAEAKPEELAALGIK